ncbi:PAQR family membrane homeostasis protein TrhA [Paracoccus benzoatiresistens]|uniref:Hemolysin III family protein n=1 Tax=Paracoccus benzoatiresistens TaxID=2997341 RepID=A0ABT4JC14_9RHOB|nr:hemolysin III family protein [Paracoccus sp. EF6]MCZ0964250.1 hemolysin III family protein [Paracoccus sp. EF6]
MINRLQQRTGYSRAENLSDFIVHAVGLSAAVLAVPILIIRTWTLGSDPAAVLGVSIYGAALITMILCSTLYNMAHPDVWTGMLRRLDHSAIYVKIAGTYTPFALLSPNPSGWFLISIWACAALGAALRSFADDHLRGAAISLYLVMGWSGAVAGGALFDEMSPWVFTLILGGGLIYTSGFLFYLMPRLPFHRTIWHLFVIAASAVFFAAVATHVLGGPGASASGPMIVEHKALAAST